jgi:anaerobic sulfite reductase subunit A
LLDEFKVADFTMDADNQDVAAGYALWQRFQKQITDRAAVNLAVDYVRIFVGTGKTSHGTAFPYESVYTSPLRLMMQEARDEALEAYRSEGIGKSTDFVDPEDHIALELAFMAHLNRKTHEFVQAGNLDEGLKYLHKQQAFLNDHLMNWVPAFCADISRFAQEDLYLGLAKVTQGFLHMEKQVLPELIVELSQTAA